MKNLDEYLVDVDIGGIAIMSDINRIESTLKVSLPYEFKTFLVNHNGVEGGVGENSYIQLWTADDIIARNRRLEVNEFAPGLILFGSDGGDTAYAYDTRNPSIPIVEVPFIGMSLKAIKNCAKDLLGFFEYLYNHE